MNWWQWTIVGVAIAANLTLLAVLLRAIYGTRWK